MLLEEPSDDIELIMVPTEIRGVKVIMMDLDQGKTTDSDAIYGIKKMEVHRPGQALALETCGA